MNGALISAPWRATVVGAEQMDIFITPSQPANNHHPTDNAAAKHLHSGGLQEDYPDTSLWDSSSTSTSLHQHKCSTHTHCTVLALRETPEARCHGHSAFS
ncbi:uncharacterized protein isoform X2 [Salmo salar]|uniref:Uncharacterized protein isoform X2 n=1 Tax=Salmo salar TaxID=8030 RepID=A0ABM3DSC9_SALSA|nr:uncharacterized protein LOC106582723 isoform X2 [Salmo salar]